jgi:hypothetical protein
MHQEALEHLSSIKGNCAEKADRSTRLNGAHTKQAVETMAANVINILQECFSVALQVCATSIKATGQVQIKEG